MGNQSTQCFDKITPHDMYSSINCALSGAFLLGGGWCTVMWGMFSQPDGLENLPDKSSFPANLITTSSNLLASDPWTPLLPQRTGCWMVDTRSFPSHSAIHNRSIVPVW